MPGASSEHFIICPPPHPQDLGKSRDLELVRQVSSNSNDKKKMMGKGGMGQACAACKYQKRKCSPECMLAPYFPAHQPKQFLNVHKLFGVSNILRILKQLDDSQKSDAMKSMVYQANAREKDPVHGCFGIIVMFQTQVERARQELEFVRSQLLLLEQHYENSDLQQQQQQNIQIQSLGGGVSQHQNPNPATGASIYPFLHSIYQGGQQQQPPPQQQGLYLQSYDMINPNKFLEYDRRQAYNDSKQQYESSVESSPKETHCLEHVVDHELKSAAALFSLTNQH